MQRIYYRVLCGSDGIYNALKKKIWEVCDYPEAEWLRFKKSDAASWLNSPPDYGRNCSSYFTELGYRLFLKNTYPYLLKFLDKDCIHIEKFTFDIDEMIIFYSDIHQIVLSYI